MIALRNRRVALIGGGGFIGHHLALRLHAAGAVVTIIDGLHVNNLLEYVERPATSPNSKPYLGMIHERLGRLRDAGVDLRVQDARDEKAIAALLDELQPHCIVHLAGISHAGKSNRYPQEAFEHSLFTLQNSLSAASRGGVEHFIYFSSSMVYGNFEQPEVTEETPCNPLGIYGSLKYSGERMVTAHQQVFDLPYTIIRPSALYGERCISRRVAQIFIEQAMAGEKLSVAGDGSDRLDFTYIDDLVDGVVNVMQNEAARNEIFNLTCGRGRSIAELIGVLREDFPAVTIQYQDRDRLMPSRGSLCVAKAKSLIDYNPQYPIERGIPRYVKWYCERAERRQPDPVVITAGRLAPLTA